MADLSTVKSICIKSYLAKQGIQPSQRSSGGWMYLSPLRSETTPSFHVDENKNQWFDHGLGRGGSIIDLIMAMERCDFSDAVERLKTGTMPTWTPPPKSSTVNSYALQVTAVKPLEHPALIRYMESRGIGRELANQYCSEVHFKIGEKENFAVGFGNDGGGYELRNRYRKLCSSPKGITTIRTGSYSTLVFEGFIDFLSYLAINRILTPAADVLVLNSVANLKRAIPFLRQHDTIYTYLDNDEAGRRCAEEIGRLLPDARHVDCSGKYAGYKDLNDYLMAIR